MVMVMVTVTVMVTVMKLRLTIDSQNAEEFVEFFDHHDQTYEGPQDDLTSKQSQALQEALKAIEPLHIYYDTTTKKLSLQ